MLPAPSPGAIKSPNTQVSRGHAKQTCRTLLDSRGARLNGHAEVSLRQQAAAGPPERLGASQGTRLRQASQNTHFSHGKNLQGSRGADPSRWSGQSCAVVKMR